MAEDRKRTSDAAARGCHEQSESGARAAQYDTLGEQLADEPPSAGAEREPHGHFTASRAGPRQQQVRDVHRRNEQQQRDDRHQHPERGGEPPSQERQAAAGIADLDLERLLELPLGAELPGDERPCSPAPGPARRPAVAAPSSGTSSRLCSAGTARSNHVIGHPDIDRLSGEHSPEARGSDADYRVVRAPEPHRLAEDTGIAAEGALPQLMRDDRGIRRREVLFGQRPAQHRRHPEHREVVAGDGREVNVPRVDVAEPTPCSRRSVPPT